MRKLFFRSTLLLILTTAVTSCWIEEENIDFPEGPVEGYRPVYTSAQDLEVRLEPARSVVNTGKIYLKRDLLFLIERFEGIHLIDNSDPANPENLSFLKVTGVSDLALRNGILYANQFEDLVAIDINDIENIRVVFREEDVLAVDGGNQVPPESGYYFECVDPSKGLVSGWELTTINSPKCYR